MKKLIAVIGPTASGKTKLAVFLAKKFNGEIVSADSRQVYQGMDIGTGKEGIRPKRTKTKDQRLKTKDQRLKIKDRLEYIKQNAWREKGIPQYLLDICDPKEQYTVAQFQKDAYKIIYDIFNRGKLPILVGGSGLYIDAVLKGYQVPKTSPRLRQELEKLSNKDLLDQLKGYDPVAYQKIDHCNRRRILRALEASIVNRRPFSEYRARKPKFNPLIIGLDLPRKKLYQRIDEKVDKRIKQGMIKEVENLLKSGITYKRLRNFGLEYRYISEYLHHLQEGRPIPSEVKGRNSSEAEKAKQEMIKNLKFKIHAFARRQLTWFRRNKEIHWLRSRQEAQKLVQKFLTQDL